MRSTIKIRVKQGDPVAPVIRDAVLTARRMRQKVEVLCEKGQGFTVCEVFPGDDYRQVMTEFELDSLKGGWNPRFFLAPLYESLRKRTDRLVDQQCLA
jgi:hypothetical protein